MQKGLVSLLTALVLLCSPSLYALPVIGAEAVDAVLDSESELQNAQPVTEPVMQPVQEPVMQPVQEPVMQPVQEPMMQPIQEPLAADSVVSNPAVLPAAATDPAAAANSDRKSVV